jgi:hypothetical protein
VQLEAARQIRVVERIVDISGLLQVICGEGVPVDYQLTTWSEARQIDLERGRVHRHEHVRPVACCVNFFRSEAELKGGNTGDRTDRRPYLRRVVGLGVHVVAVNGRRSCELRARELHTVAGIAGKDDGDTFDFGGVRGVRIHRITHLPVPEQSGRGPAAS